MALLSIGALLVWLSLRYSTGSTKTSSTQTGRYIEIDIECPQLFEGSILLSIEASQAARSLC